MEGQDFGELLGGESRGGVFDGSKGFVRGSKDGPGAVRQSFGQVEFRHQIAERGEVAIGARELGNGLAGLFFFHGRRGDGSSRSGTNGRTFFLAILEGHVLFLRQHYLVYDVHDPVAGFDIDRNNLWHVLPGVECPLLVDLVVLADRSGVVAVGHGDLFLAGQIRAVDLAPVDGVEGQETVQRRCAVRDAGQQIAIDFGKGIVSRGKNRPRRRFIAQAIEGGFGRDDEIAENGEARGVAR
mmetsp:Transcript_24694/g.54386  ORF Transcript_24694/g.54386 Transcript_24694/m.54386 type:complete len:240 (+) Transcript_24694:689-1408(+)